MFYCPIHKTYKYKLIDVDCTVDTISQLVCEDCLQISKEVESIDRWFYHSNEKLDALLKQKIKNFPIEHFYVNLWPRLGSNKDMEFKHYVRYNYINKQLTKIEIYECGINHYDTKICVRTQKKTKYVNLSPCEDLPIHLALDNKYIENLLNQ